MASTMNSADHCIREWERRQRGDIIVRFLTAQNTTLRHSWLMSTLPLFEQLINATPEHADAKRLTQLRHELEHGAPWKQNALYFLAI